MSTSADLTGVPPEALAPAPAAAPRATMARYGVIALYVLAYAGTWIAVQAPVVVSLPLQVEAIAPAHTAQSLSFVLLLGSLVAFGSPLFGRLSDRTRSRFGRRRPWLLGGAVIGLAGAIILAAASTVPALTIGWCLVKLGGSVSLAALLAVLAEFIVSRQRGLVAGLLGICPPIGAAAGAWLVNAFSGSTTMMFLAPAFVAAGVAIAFVAVMPEGPAPIVERRPVLRGLLVNVRKHPDFGWAWLSRFVFFLAVGSIVSYQVLYLRHELGKPKSEIPELIAFATLIKTIVIVAASLVMGRLSDRVGARKPFVFCAALLFIAGPVVIVLSGTYTGFVVGLAIIGLALGTYAPVDLALVIDVLPNRDEAGKDLGVLNLATTLPGSVAPALAPLLLAVGSGSYTPLFLATAVFAGVAALLVMPIRGVR
jgi:MFS family permease